MNKTWWQRYEGRCIEGAEGSYYLQALIGCGGFGGVYAAIQQDADKHRRLALKLILPQEHDLQGELRELVRGLRFKHQHLVEGLDGGLVTLEDVQFLFLLMELGETTLESTLTAPLPEKDALTLALHLAGALEYLHARDRNIVHRDLKPANILRIGLAWKVADYGIARRIGPQTYLRTQTVIGSIRYMPPESFDGLITPVWDTWSLGVILCQSLTGQLPFTGAGEWELRTSICMHQPTFGTNMPAAFDRLLNGCLEKDYRKRWSATTVLQELRTLLDKNKTLTIERNAAGIEQVVQRPVPSAAPGPVGSDKIVLSVRTKAADGWPAGARSAIQAAHETIVERLTAAGFGIAGPNDANYRFAVTIRYSGISPFGGEYSYRLKIRTPDGTLLDTDEGISHYRGAVYDFPLIGPYTTAVVRQNPAPLIALMRASLLQGYDGITVSSSLAITLGRFGTPDVVDVLSEALYCGLVTAENARHSLIKISTDAPDPVARQRATEALDKKRQAELEDKDF